MFFYYDVKPNNRLTKTEAAKQRLPVLQIRKSHRGYFVPPLLMEESAPAKVNKEKFVKSKKTAAKISANAPAKRQRGRPRKTAPKVSASSPAKRQRGRPKTMAPKISTNSPAKRQRGRPKQTDAEISASLPAKRQRGRPDMVHIRNNGRSWSAINTALELVKFVRLQNKIKKDIILSFYLSFSKKSILNNYLQ